MQAPMGGASGPELAACVSNAGGVGSLPIWTVHLDQVPSLVAATMKLTSRPFSVNVRADLPQEGHVLAALDGGAALIHLFWGDPAPCAGAIHGAGAKLVVTVATADETKRALDCGADVLVAQGWEAGGHVRGTLTTMALVPTVADLAGHVPVLAAGGIVDGRGLAAALMLGASGVMMGTRFVASLESSAHPHYKSAVVAARQVEAVFVADVFNVGWSEAPHRVLRNSTVREWEDAGRPPTGARPREGEIVAVRADGSPIPRYSVATPGDDVAGDIEAMAQYAGQGVEGVREVLSAEEIIAATVREARDCLSRYAR